MSWRDWSGGWDLQSRMQPSRRIVYHCIWLTTVKAPVMIMPRNGYRPQQPIRRDLVARVRREIQQGAYDTPEKLEVALRRLFQEMGEDFDSIDVEALKEQLGKGRPRRW